MLSNERFSFLFPSICRDAGMSSIEKLKVKNPGRNRRRAVWNALDVTEVLIPSTFTLLWRFPCVGFASIHTMPSAKDKVWLNEIKLATKTQAFVFGVRNIRLFLYCFLYFHPLILIIGGGDDGHELLLCDSCPNSFCVLCVARHFGKREVSRLKPLDNWSC